MKALTLLLLIMPTLSYSSSCTEHKWHMECEHIEIQIEGLYGQRKALVAYPKTEKPQKGFPVAMFYHGSFFPMQFNRPKLEAFGAFNEIKTVKALLDAGFMVVAPKAGANLFWQTNIPGFNYNISADRYFIEKILYQLKTGIIESADISNLFAFGISSGGYMTDRMAYSHQDYNFKSLVVVAGSYAKCAGINCPMPDTIPSNHPPTLFIHGKRDLTVPLYTMKKYAKLLEEASIETQTYIDAERGHAWPDKSPQLVLDWFNKFLN